MKFRLFPSEPTVDWARVLRALKQIDERLDRIERALHIDVALAAASLREQEHTMAILDDLEARVASVQDVEQSAVTLIIEIHDELADALAANDTGRIQAAIDKLGSSSDTLAAAVVANTPAATGASSEPPSDTSDTGTPDTTDTGDTSFEPGAPTT